MTTTRARRKTRRRARSEVRGDFGRFQDLVDDYKRRQANLGSITNEFDRRIEEIDLQQMRERIDSQMPIFRSLLDKLS